MTRIGTAAIAALLLTAPSWAQYSPFLKDAPVSRLSEDEFKAFWAFVGETLDAAPDGQTVEWKATQATFTSKLTPQKRFTDGALQCRGMTIDSDSRDRHESARYEFCKVGKDWKFRAPSRRAK